MSSADLMAPQTTWREQVHSYKAHLLRSYLRKHHGRCGETARELGLHRNTLTRLMSELHIDPVEVRRSFLSQSKRPTPKMVRRETEPNLRELIAERDPPLTRKERTERMMYLAAVLAKRPASIAGKVKAA